ncbi:MAG TPA: ABC transporter ATP-binding protein [Vicinamibacteria bacterium]|nr:ABC transporter ATP-binding protein [Vicinamibacteria bacterium]
MSEPLPESVLAAEDVSVRYGRTVVLDGISFEVPRGSVWALLGRNGSGKSSLVRCLLGEQKPTRGRTRLFGLEAWSSRRRAMARVGVVPEEPDAPPDMTAPDLAAFCGRLYRSWNAEDVASRLRRSGVPEGVPFGRLSKGQKGAVMLALALGHRPELLVLDDPTLGLDAVARHAVYEEIIGELADRGTTVFLTTHDLAGVERLADRVAIVKEHHLATNEPLDDLKGRFRRVRCAGNGPPRWAPFEAASVRARPWGAEAVVSNYDEANFERFRASAGSANVEVLSLSLEEIFIAVAGEDGGRE